MAHPHEVKTRAYDLQIGMFVCRLDKEWVDTDYPLQGFFVENDAQIQKLADECDYVFVDTARKGFSSSTSPTSGISCYSNPAAVQKNQKKLKSSLSKAKVVVSHKISTPKKSFLNLRGLLALLDQEQQYSDRKHTYRLSDIVTHKVSPASIKPLKKSAKFHQEISFAKQAHTQAANLLKTFISKVKEGEAINIICAEQAVHDCMLSALRSPDALLLASHLYKKHLHVWEHSMRVCVLAINLGRCLNLTDEDLMTLGLCGMLHDIGALLISKEMLEESDDKIELMQSHTILGRDILLSCSGEFSVVAADVAYCHHEYLNGSGFPRGLKGDQISAYTRIITLIDAYVNLTTDGKNHKGLTHYQAIVKLLERTNTYFDEVLVHCLSQCLGTYPVGCYVEMNTGEVGVVVEENMQEKLKPKIMLMTTDDKKPRPNHLIDLAALKNEEVLYEIASIVPPDEFAKLN